MGFDGRISQAEAGTEDPRLWREDGLIMLLRGVYFCLMITTFLDGPAFVTLLYSTLGDSGALHEVDGCRCLILSMLSVHLARALAVYTI
jgi:hypothetical protein